jgi:hypothetical protein
VAKTIKVNAGNRVEVQLTDWRYLVRETRKIEPASIATLQRNAFRIGRPVEKKVQQGITNRFAIKGMQQKVVPGRLTWGATVPAKKTELRVDTRMRKKGKSIVSIWAMSPAVAIFDTARKYGKFDGQDTNYYEYSRAVDGFRKHKRNKQGKYMVEAMDRSPARKQVSRSRVIWPSGLSAVPQANAEMNILLEQTAQKINAEIQRNA